MIDEPDIQMRRKEKNKTKQKKKIQGARVVINRRTERRFGRSWEMSRDRTEPMSLNGQYGIPTGR